LGTNRRSGAFKNDFEERMDSKDGSGSSGARARRIGYARVSSEDQNLALQIDALKAAGCDRIFRDRMTGATYRRDAFDRALRALEPGGELVVWKLDRFGRSTFETVLIVHDLARRGIGFRSLTESFDIKTAIGKGVLAFLAAIAEDELERIRLRTRAGMAAARARGVVLGRPPKLSEEQVTYARRELRAGAATPRSLAAEFGVSPLTVSRALKRRRKAA
jgi:DNA invertase Pin-like site-specific DNA recombinase